jgi:hypothetical protein
MAEHVLESTLDRDKVGGVMGCGIGSVEGAVVGTDIGSDVVAVLTCKKSGRGSRSKSGEGCALSFDV